ncbi:sulfite oxidase heme-binding subunit YedZ [Magnetospira sp. QH-2]|uniref:sulfite oxidase heme-binding subunit YedZ n=1 Tax=Magnetospira sp. (strain QH-2) TaxID=1288970 RepID=UPI0003E80F1B|nr:protein-methionine-sulfoxide reductase heme-binding subunit MsrQ [Magnetospira sp. QH-2]CCQ72051.1 molybdoenzyme heme-containing subunit YedZ [Magnetospira sp. QH-2]
MKILKVIVFTAALGPLAWLIWGLADGTLGANPAEAANRFLGDWALRFLLVTLALTPLRKITGRGEFGRFRRMMGLYAFFYAVLHVTSYVVLDQFFDWAAIWADLIKRTYITIGMGALLMLLPLAATSTKGMIQRIGGARWRKLHRLVYPASILVVIHFYMMTRARDTEVLIHAVLLGALLGYRVWAARRGLLPMLQRP